MGQRGVKRRREEEPDTRFFDARAHDLRGDIQSHAERFEDVGGTDGRGRGAVAVFGDRDPAARDGQRGHGRDVHAVELIAARANDVDHLGSNLKRGRRSDHGVDEPRHLVRRFALGGEGREDARNEYRVDATVENLGERPARRLSIEVVTTNQWVEDFESERLHVRDLRT